MWLDDLKRRVYLVALPLMAAAAAVGFLLNRPSGNLQVLNLVLGPTVFTFALGVGFVLWRRLWSLGRVETVLYMGLAAFMLVRIAVALFFVDEANPLAFTFAAFAPWIGAVLVLAFVMFQTRTALRVTLALYAAMLALAATYLVQRGLGAVTRFELNALLQQFLVANACYIALLVVLSRAKEEYGKAEYVSAVMSRLAHTDELLGVPNRRHIGAAGEKEVERIARHPRPFSVILVDVDHFKAVNDTHGHAVGDLVLKELVKVVARELRAGDEIGRWGGEEFLVLAYDAGEDVAAALADRLRRALEENEPEGIPKITASFGVSSHRPDDSFEALVERADRALYDAKEGGRNQVAVR